MLSKMICNMHIYIDSDHKKEDFSSLRLYCTPAGTRLLCQHMFATWYYQILLKITELSVVSDPRSVLRDKQGPLTKLKLGFF